MRNCGGFDARDIASSLAVFVERLQAGANWADFSKTSNVFDRPDHVRPSSNGWSRSDKATVKIAVCHQPMSHWLCCRFIGALDGDAPPCDGDAPVQVEATIQQSWAVR